MSETESSVKRTIEELLSDEVLSRFQVTNCSLGDTIPLDDPKVLNKQRPFLDQLIYKIIE